MNILIKKYNGICLTAVIILNLSNCTMFSKDYKQVADFDTHPSKYWQAKASNEIAIPRHLAKNIKKEPIYIIPLDKSVNGELQISKIPPTLNGKISEYD